MYELPPKSSRGNRHHERVEELITHLAAEFIARESNGTSLITATRTKLSAQNDRAEVFVTVFPDELLHSALDFLNRQADAFRIHLKSHARLRSLPRVTFSHDEGERGRQRLDELGKKA